MDTISGGNNNTTDPVGLLQAKLPVSSLQDAGRVADYFLSIFFPGEGRANLSLYRESALRFLNTADDGVAPSLFEKLSPGTAAYETRIRGVVAMLLSFARFQEQ